MPTKAKRLGLCQKSLFVVPNHLTEQWASEFLRLYPSANILVTTKKDFETHIFLFSTVWLIWNSHFKLATCQ